MDTLARDLRVPQLNIGARIPVCGPVPQNNATSLPEGPDRMSWLPEFAAEMDRWLMAGKIHYREEIIDGLEQAPAAFIGMLQGENLGKCVTRVGGSQ